MILRISITKLAEVVSANSVLRVVEGNLFQYCRHILQNPGAEVQLYLEGAGKGLVRSRTSCVVFWFL